LIDPDNDEDDLSNSVNALSIFQLQENVHEGENVNSKGTWSWLGVSTVLYDHQVHWGWIIILTMLQCTSCHKASDWACTNWQHQDDKSHLFT
jgi:hypothetical protein